ncbi:MAG: hypothetical protein COB20_13060 [SAR86 cluster bacterium]|uniref:Lipoprotein n=1 Tax=SAR86 cluster bacterium TaxID=2030880 RepID=A0A2A4WY85_9GAMM|nr:MAG: hypothetical protein COB20_13060 [SAR86 cluster bacterium]
MKKLLSGLLVLSLSVLVGCAAGGPPPAAGVWDSVIVSPLGDLPVVLTLNADGTGEMASDVLNAPLSGIVYADNTAAFTAEISVQGQEIVLDFTGTAEGDTLNGEFGSDFGAMAVTATRQ